jgi:hypothetical protein
MIAIVLNFFLSASISILEEAQPYKETYFIIDEGGKPVASWSKRSIYFKGGKRVNFDAPIAVIPSKLGNFIGVFYPKGDSLFFRLYDSNGVGRWTISFPSDQYRARDFLISDMGIVISVETAPAFFEIFDPSGRRLKSFFLYKNGGFVEDRPLYMDISEDGLKFAVYTLKDYGSPPEIFLFNIKGEELMRKKLEGYPAGVIISPHENFLLAISHGVEKMGIKERYAFLLPKEGKLLHKFYSPLLRARFSKDETLILISGKRWFELYSLPDADLILRKRTELRIYDAAISLDGSILLIKATGHYRERRFVYDWLYFTVFDKGGEKLESGSIKGPSEIALIRTGWRKFFVSIQNKLVRIDF